ncbi:MAG: N-6 DNA methylase [Deltaproteobacteria bacterium]|nr:N-6 DNA methylase [Deltaproteobacteria bacterium]
MVAKPNLINEHMSPPSGMLFYNSLESACNDLNVIGYWSAIRRAWNELNLDGVLCVDGRPVLYLKEHGRPFTVNERVRLQKLFWNQGICNLLVLTDPTTVYIYSGLGTPPQDDNDIEKGKGLVEELTLVEYVHRIKAMYHDLASGHYYETHYQKFDPEQSVDSWLLDNLKALRNALTEGDKGLEIKDAHSLIGRILFLCYLLDRRIYSIGTLAPNQTGTMLLASKLESLSFKDRINYLYGNLFNDLRERFNGNMFDQALDSEAKKILPEHLNKLVDFLGGHQVQTGQKTLGFWVYDFKMIPVETISAIYQDFLGAEDQENQKERGAFYTPRFLAEMVIDVALNGDMKAYDWSYLDPACGSGIFLVTLFNRLANFWIYSQTGHIHYTTKAKALNQILDRQIRGIDVEVTACRIACFSLYLAYLDFFDPCDINEYVEKTGKPLPKLLDYGDEVDRSTADIPVIHKADFLKGELFKNKTFDCIVGNPPWKGRQSKQLAQKFLEKAPQYLIEQGIGCLLLPSKIIQNQTDSFQGEWLKSVTLEKVIQLADYRFVLFQNALCPAIIARFKNSSPHAGQHQIEFNAPKFNRDGLRKGVITINPSASSWIHLSEILSASKNKMAPLVWKKRLWGTNRDQKFFDIMQSIPSLENHVDVLSNLRLRGEKQTKRWIAGQGLKPWPDKKLEKDADRNPKKIKWPLNTKCIKASWWCSDLILSQYDTISLESMLKEGHYRTDVFYSQPPPDLFKTPIVLVSQGFGKVAYSDFDVLFQNSFHSISGPLEDTYLLKFLAVYLRSNLAKYFLFHTSANWGSERDKVHLFELLRVPFGLPGDEFISPDAEQIIKNVTKKIDKLHYELNDMWNELSAAPKGHAIFPLGNEALSKKWQKERKEKVDLLQKELEPLIYKYFELTQQEITLIEDTINIFIPSSTPTTWRTPKTVTIEPLQNTKIKPYYGERLKPYAETLTNTLNEWAQAEGSKYRVSAEGCIDEKIGLAMVSVYISNSIAHYKEAPLFENNADLFIKLQKQVSRKKGKLVYERDIFYILRDRIFIIRPNILFNWTRTAALNDAAKIYAEIALAKKEP